MRPRDAVKLLYQRAFGCGHLIGDAAATLAYLRQEAAQAAPRPAGALLEDIGGGFVRVQLGAMAAAGLTAERLNDVFVRSAAAPAPDAMAAFLADLDLLGASAAVFAFPPAELAGFLDGYRAAGCPALRHSPAYRAAYAPAYRVVRAELFRAACPEIPFVLY